MSTDHLRIQDLRELWKEKSSPSIRQEIKAEILALRSSINAVTQGYWKNGKILSQRNMILEAYKNPMARQLASIRITKSMQIKQKHAEFAETIDTHRETLHQLNASG